MCGVEAVIQEALSNGDTTCMLPQLAEVMTHGLNDVKSEQKLKPRDTPVGAQTRKESQRPPWEAQEGTNASATSHGRADVSADGIDDNSRTGNCHAGDADRCVHARGQAAGRKCLCCGWQAEMVRLQLARSAHTRREMFALLFRILSLSLYSFSLAGR